MKQIIVKICNFLRWCYQDLVRLLRAIVTLMRSYFKNYLRLGVRTTYENPYHRAHAIVVLLFTLPLAYFVYSENTFNDFFVGVFAGAFVLGLTIILANFIIFEPLKSWQSDRDVAVGLAFANSTLCEYVKGLENEIIRVCDYQERSFQDRREAVDLSGGLYTSAAALNMVITEQECGKAFQQIGLFSNQRLKGNLRIYKGLITEVQSLKNVIAVLPSLLKPLNELGEAALNSYTHIIKSQKNIDSLILEIENAEDLLSGDKLCEQSDKDTIRQLLTLRVKQLYAEVFISPLQG